MYMYCFLKCSNMYMIVALIREQYNRKMESIFLRLHIFSTWWTGSLLINLYLYKNKCQNVFMSYRLRYKRAKYP